MAQHARFKEQHPDCLLLFRMGDFYELFGEDAVIANKALGITLTNRNGQSMAGVPHHALDAYLRRLIEQGHRVAVCDQVQDPKEAKGVVERAVTRVVTPGTLVDESLLDESRPNQVAAIVFTESGDAPPAVIAAAELSTGAFTLMKADEGEAIDALARLALSEIIYVETADGVPPPRIKAIRAALQCAITPRPAWTFRQSEATEALAEHFQVKTLAGFGLADDDQALAPAGALLRYLQDTQQADTAGERGGLRHLRPPQWLTHGDTLHLDAATLRSLEIERTMRTGDSEGSLFNTLQRATTPMGRRLLRHWLCFPLRDRSAIEARQDAVAALNADATFADQLGDSLNGVQDIARIVGRLGLNRATPRDLVALGNSISRVDKLVELLDGPPAFASQRARLDRIASDIQPLAKSIADRCVEEPPAHMREGGLFRDGIDAELDECRSLQRDANSWLAGYQAELTEQTGITNLKVGYNKVFGYYIELSNANRGKAPDSFIRKQTLKNAERFITPPLKEFEEKVTTASDRAISREKLLFDRLCEKAARFSDSLRDYAETIAELDVLLNFSDIARRFNYVRPTIVDEPVLNITAGRHPVLDRSLADQFVPNDCRLSTEEAHASLALITGPNMAGKSTFIRQTALIVLLAHTGCFVPAESATIGITDRIFTRIGASDELHAGQSTFMVEMTEAANILHHATDRSLVILDEIGRGTSTLDGLSLAWAIAETISDIGCRAFFATHYHELTTLAETSRRVTNLHVSVREWGDEIRFLYRIHPGAADQSYGIHVAKIAGLPSETIRRAQQLLDSLAVQTAPSDGLPTQQQSQATSNPQLGLFTEYVDHPAITELKSLDLAGLSPLQAFDALRSIQAELEQSH